MSSGKHVYSLTTYATSHMAGRRVRRRSGITPAFKLHNLGYTRHVSIPGHQRESANSDVPDEGLNRLRESGPAAHPSAESRQPHRLLCRGDMFLSPATSQPCESYGVVRMEHT